MIDHILQITSPHGKYNHMTVFYESGKKVTYYENDNLPMSVVMFLLNAGYEKEYKDYGKLERYTR